MKEIWGGHEKLTDNIIRPVFQLTYKSYAERGVTPAYICQYHK